MTSNHTKLDTLKQKIKKHMKFMLAALASGLLLAIMVASPSVAQSLSLDLGSEGSLLSGRVVQMILMLTVLSVAPSIMIMMTSFTRLIIVFSLLRSAMGTQSTPPNMVMVSLAMFLTGYIMTPTFTEIWQQSIDPMVNEQIDGAEAYERGIIPMKNFMLAQVRNDDVALFLDLAQTETPAKPQDIAITVLIPAFMISELRRGFEIGFLLFIPFIVIDMVVASILMSMGMMMLPPIMIALPFKIIFFVLVDGWHLVAGSLVQSFNVPLPPGV